MKIVLHAEHDLDIGYSRVTVEHEEIEYLGDFAEALLQFTRAVGYNYVKRVIIVKDDGNEIGSDL